MERTEQQKQEIRDAFAVRRKRQIAIAGVFIAMILVFYAMKWAGIEFGDGASAATMVIFLTLIVGAVIFSFSNWRCPGCNAYLGRSLGHRFCPSCGVQLR